jgi:hypothetical protein
MQGPGSVVAWDDWWAANEARVRELFPKLEYLRLKARGLVAAEDYLRRTGQLIEPIRLDPEFIHLLQSIDWLSKSGHPLPDCPAGVVLAESGAKAFATARQPGTVALRQGQSIGLYNYVGANAREVHVRWNNRARAMNDWLDASGLMKVWVDRLIAVGADGDMVKGIRSDVLFAWLGHEHRSIPGCPESHLRLFSWYRLGRLVCGWSGNWPEGSLVVY